MSRRVLLVVVLVVVSLLGAVLASAVPSAESSVGAGAARSARSRVASNAMGAMGSHQHRLPLLQLPLDIMDDDDEALFEANKRQMSDDYGHMRFGKRGGGDNDFAEYGHMRFGRAAAAAA